MKSLLFGSSGQRFEMGEENQIGKNDLDCACGDVRTPFMDESNSFSCSYFIEL